MAQYEQPTDSAQHRLVEAPVTSLVQPLEQ